MKVRYKKRVNGSLVSLFSLKNGDVFLLNAYEKAPPWIYLDMVQVGNKKIRAAVRLSDGYLQDMTRYSFDTYFVLLKNAVCKIKPEKEVKK